MIYLYETVDIAFLINLMVAFWNCCLALFKSSLPSPEQSRYLETCKIHGEKRGSHDRRFTDFGMAICPCRPIEVIAVSAVNSGSNNSDYSPSFSHPSSLFLALSPPYSRSYSSGLGKLQSCWYFASAKRSANSIGYVLWNDLISRGTKSAKTTIYLSRAHWPHTRRKHNRSKGPMPALWVRPSIRGDCHKPPC